MPNCPEPAVKCSSARAVHQPPNLNALQALPRASRAMPLSPELHRLRNRIETRTATVGVCGMGYVGLPSSSCGCECRISRSSGSISTPDKTKALNEGVSYITGVGSDNLKGLREAGKLRGSHDFMELSRCDVVAVCVPTPLTRPSRARPLLHRNDQPHDCSQRAAGATYCSRVNELSRHN